MHTVSGYKMKLIPALFLSVLLFTGIAGAADQNSINEQLKQERLIHLPAGTYILTDSIVLQSNTILRRRTWNYNNNSESCALAGAGGR